MQQLSWLHRGPAAGLLQHLMWQFANTTCVWSRHSLGSVLLPAQIHFEDFRMFSESFGMQLDDDSLLALYHVHDSEGR